MVIEKCATFDDAVIDDRFEDPAGGVMRKRFGLD